MAVKYRFDKDWDYDVSPRVTAAYKAGTTPTVPEAHAEAADAVGVGERLKDEGAKPDGERRKP